MARILRRRLLIRVARLHPLLLLLIRVPRQLLHPLLLFPVPRLLALAQAPLQLLHQYNVSTKKMSVSLAQEKNLVKEYYNRIRGENQSRKKERNLNKALAFLLRREGYKARDHSPLHPKREKKEINGREENYKEEDIYSGLTDEEMRELNKLRGVGVGGRRTRRSRRRQTRHRASRRR